MRFYTVAAMLAATLVGSQVVDPNSVPLATRQYWCVQQTSSCPLICLQLKGGQAGTLYNSCDAATLNYECVCANGLSPNVSEYSQTVPYFECTTFNTQCVDSCAIGDSACATACVDDHPCGAQNPKRYKTTDAPASTTSATPTPGAPLTNDVGVTTGHVAAATLGPSLNGNNGGGSVGSGSSDGSSGSGNGAGELVVRLGQVYGTALLAVGVVGGFALGL